MIRVLLIYIMYLFFISTVISVLCSELFFFFFQAEDGIRDLVRSRGLGDVYKRQARTRSASSRLSPPSP